MRRFKFLSKDKISNLPQNLGVYIFKKEREFLYIGKARDIRERVKSHFFQPGFKEKMFLDKVEKIGYLKTGSETEALILEVNLIKKYQPKYNVVWRDDKNYFFVAITQENFPRVFITHQIKIKNQKSKIKNIFIGPFVDGKALKQILKILRKVFPFRTCKTLPKRSCLWYHLERCPGPCRSKIKNQKSKIKNICQKNAKNLIKILQALLPGSRIEAYDVSNIQGKEAAGAMVTFINGKPDKNFYRRFKIKTSGQPNDIAMIKEILRRRLGHPEWGWPDLILIDGGIAQLNTALKIKNQISKIKNIKVLSLAKKENKLYIEGYKKPILLNDLPREFSNLILQLRDEAHRFARKYHHQLRKKTLLN